MVISAAVLKLAPQSGFPPHFAALITSSPHRLHSAFVARVPKFFLLMCIKANNRRLACFECHPGDCFLDLPSCLSPFLFLFSFDSFRREVQQSENKDLAISWRVRIARRPGGRLAYFPVAACGFSVKSVPNKAAQPSRMESDTAGVLHHKDKHR